MARPTFEFGSFSLDPAEHRLLSNGQPVALTPRVFDLLRVLVENAGHLVEKERLLTEVWHDAVVEEANLTRAISVLRKVLGENGTTHYIETVPKVGYRFIVPVHVRHGDPFERGERVAHRVHRRALVAALAASLLLAAGTLAYIVLSGRAPAGGIDAAGGSRHRQITFTGKELTPSLSPDGQRAAYVSNEPPYRKVMVQDLAGGPPVEVFRAPETGGLRWSPDSSALVFFARGGGTDGVYIAQPPAAPARRLGGGGGTVVCWSPDGSTIAVAAFVGRRILFVNRSGAVQRSIALQGVQDWIWDLDWSAVNGRILFVVDDDRRRPAVWSIRQDGTDQTKLLTGTGEILAARWAPGHEAFYYFARVNQTVSLYKVPVDFERNALGGHPVELLSGLETDEGFGLSADASRLVYARAPYHSNLWIVEADGRAGLRQTQLTRGTSVIERPRVSPDGRSILFSMGYESHANLYTIPAEGGSPRQLTFLNALSTGGVWSPDGRSVAFASNEGGLPRVWVTNADGASPRPLSSGNLSESYELAWAPGNRLLYQQAGNQNYYVSDSQLAHHDLLIGDPSVGWIANSAYSPDGSKVAVGWNRRSGTGPYAMGIYVIDTATRRETLIYRLPKDSSAVPIGWSPDGAAIYAFDGTRAAYRGVLVPYELTVTNVQILRVPINGAPVETVAALPFEEVGTIAVFPDGRRFVCSVYTSRSDVWVVEDFDRPLPLKTAGQF
jgi:Tol biopolymer transport system component/DNA-binding winged helix-turn-helix (wHTH) protein